MKEQVNYDNSLNILKSPVNLCFPPIHPFCDSVVHYELVSKLSQAVLGKFNQATTRQFFFLMH